MYHAKESVLNPVDMEGNLGKICCRKVIGSDLSVHSNDSLEGCLREEFKTGVRGHVK